MAQLTPQEAKASLGLATGLMQKHLISQKPQEQPQEQGQEQPTEQEADPKIAELEAKFTDFQKEVKDTIKNEIGDLKQTIKDALNEETTSEKPTE